jgi:hypothetical protein
MYLFINTEENRKRTKAELDEIESLNPAMKRAVGYYPPEG